MKYAKKRNNKKPIACALGVLLSLAPSFCISESAVVDAYADDLNSVEQFLYDLGEQLYISNQDYYDAFIDGSVEIIDNNITGMSVVNSTINTYYQNLLSAISTNSEMSSGGSTYTGFYRTVNGGPIYSGQIYLKQSVAKGQGRTLCVTSEHFNMVVYYEWVGAEAQAANPDLNMYSQIVGNYYTYYFGNPTNYGAVVRWYDSSNYLSGSGSTSISKNSNGNVGVRFGTSSNIPTITEGSTGGANGRGYLGSGYIGDLPQLGEPMTKANAINYYNDLVHYLQDTYPDVPTTQIPFPTGYDPYNPEYPSPTDNYIGIPAEWTIENPQLPTSPTINFNKYSPDLSTLNPLDTLANYTDVVEGISFWWTLFEVASSKMHIFEFFMIFLGLAVAGYILWYLGS